MWTRAITLSANCGEGANCGKSFIAFAMGAKSSSEK
jgi:hypothetical protein